MYPGADNPIGQCTHMRLKGYLKQQQLNSSPNPNMRPRTNKPMYGLFIEAHARKTQTNKHNLNRIRTRTLRPMRRLALVRI